MKNILLLLALIFVTPTHAAISDWQRGASIQPTTPTQFATPEFKQSLINLKGNNANYVNLVIPIYQNNIYETNIWAGGDTPTDATLKTAIDTAHSVGLKVSLKPHIESKDGQWRAKIDPTNRTTWFANYGAFIKRYAAIAEAHGAEQFIVGTELIALSADDYNVQNTPAWRKLIAEVREIYSGTIVYAANWGTGLADEKNRIAFWDAVDVVGVDAYYPLGSDYGDISIEHFRNYWAQIEQNDIKPFQQKVNRPIMFTEIGYRSTNGTHIDPGNYQHTDGVSEQEQANLYEALFSFWNDKSYIQGIHLWNWDAKPNAGGPTDPDYTPQNKLAENIMKKWFGTTTVTTFPITPIGSNTSPAFNAVTSVPPGNLFINSPINLDTQVTNNGTTVSNSIIDVEIYDSNDVKVFQKFYENQTISGSKSFTTTWTPAVTGDYKVKVGVFSSGWSKNYLWQANAQQFTVRVSNLPVVESTYTVSVPEVTGLLGKPITFNTTIQSSSQVSGILTDVEVYSVNGQKVAQQVFENQTFNIGEIKQFPLTFTPNSVSVYTVKVGVFANGWATNKVWKDNAGTITVAPFVVPPATTTPPVIIPPVATTTPPVIVPPVATTTPATTTPPVVTPPVATTTSSCSNTITTNAFSGCFYDNKDFTSFKLSRIDTVLDFDWGDTGPISSIDRDSFSAVWNGSFSFENGEYEFKVNADDGVRVYVDGVRIIDEWKNGSASYNVKKTLSAGDHVVKVEYYEESGGAKMQLSWRKVGEVTVPPVVTPTVPVVPSLLIISPSGNVTGQQLFKASMTGLNLSDYSMFWQVDGDVYNPMYTAGDHKEAAVDLTYWNWKGNGPYNINFTAKDLNGNVIGEKSVDITI